MAQPTTTKPATAPKTVSLTPRAVEALWRAVEMMAVDDPKRLASVLVEIASEELEQSSYFANRVGVLYRALEPVKPAKRTTPSKPKSGQKPKGLPADIVPLKHIEGSDFNLGATPNPYDLLDIYGSRQLPRVLATYSATALKEAAAIVQEHRPGTRPEKQTKAFLIEYIMSHVAQP